MNITRKFFKATLTAAVVSLAGVGAASASTLIDFTDSSQYNGVVPTPINTTLAGVGTTITRIGGGNLNFVGTAGGTCPVAILACEVDGAGINDDEITGLGLIGGEGIEVLFDSAVSLAGIHLLDLFIGPQGTEVANIVINGVGPGDQAFAVEAQGGGNSGYQFFDLGGMLVTSLRFYAPLQDGDDGTNDYALAAIQAVPVPAAGLMLLTALGGLGFARRKRKSV